MTSHTAIASASGFRSVQTSRPSGAGRWSVWRAKRPVMKPVDYRRNGLTSHEELPMAYRAAPFPAEAVASSHEQPQAAKAPRLVPYIAFFVAVFASVAAAAAVVGNDLPVVMVGLL